MPTTRQIQEAYKAARAMCPGARIKSVGPQGVIFDYPDQRDVDVAEWEGKPFTGDPS